MSEQTERLTDDQIAKQFADAVIYKSSPTESCHIVDGPLHGLAYEAVLFGLKQGRERFLAFAEANARAQTLLYGTFDSWVPLSKLREFCHGKKDL